MAQQSDPRIGELLAHEIETGRPLPMAAAEIVALEDAGYFVNLETGTIHNAAGLAQTHIDATPYGQAIAVLMAKAGAQ